jgi:hypothetical protein
MTSSITKGNRAAYFQQAEELRTAYQNADSQGDAIPEDALQDLIDRFIDLENAFAEAAKPLLDRTDALNGELNEMVKCQNIIRSLFPKSFKEYYSNEMKEHLEAKEGVSPNVLEGTTLEGFGNELEWILIDFLGTIRNSFSVYTTFAGAAAAPWVLAAVPIMAIAGGAMCLHSSLFDTIPGAWKDQQKAMKLADLERAPDITEGEEVGSISLANQVMFAVIGASLSAYGIVGMLTPTVGHILGYTPVLSAGAAATAEMVLNGLFGGTCLLRGCIMVGRGAYNLSYIVPFHDNFISALKSEDDPYLRIEAGLEMLAEEWNYEKSKYVKTEEDDDRTDIELKEFAEMGIDEENPGNTIAFEHFKRRVGEDAAKKMQEYMNDPSSFDDHEKKIDLLRAIDKGAFTQKVKQALIIIIGILMIAGAIACLAAAHPFALVAVLAAISIAFALMESQWLVFDWSWFFSKIADALYYVFEMMPCMRTPIPKLSDLQISDSDITEEIEDEAS